MPAASIADLPKDVRGNLDKIAEWTISHMNSSLSNREHLERMWKHVDSYMAGFHFFSLDATGQWHKTPLKDGEVRAAYPLMRSAHRRELGRFTENVLTVQGLAASPSNRSSFHYAKRAEMIINAWQEETDFGDVFEDWSDFQIHYGISALHRYIDPFKKQVLCEAWPARELHPIPWNATLDRELEGFERVRTMPRAWIEQNIGMEAGSKCGKSAIGNSAGSFINAGSVTGSKSEEVGTVIWVWMLPTQEMPHGVHYLLVEDEIFAYNDGTNSKTLPLRNGKFPVEFSRYAKQTGNWFGMGLLPTLIGSQYEADRQWSKQVRSARMTSGLLFIDDEVVDTNEMMDYDREIIRMDMKAYDVDSPFYYYLPPAPANRDVGSTLSLALESGRLAAGHESDILFSKAEGRVESGPLGRILNVNAQAPIAPTLSHMHRALGNTYYDVLDMCGEIWPEEKVVRTVGEYDIVEEQLVAKDQMPTSKHVIIRPSPLLPAGKTEMFNLLLQLRQMQSDDGKPEISSSEFRHGLSSIRMLPHGIGLASEKEQRIRQRVLSLYGDGQKPGTLAGKGGDLDMQLIVLEDIQALRDEIANFVLKPGFLETASDAVKRAFLEALATMSELLTAGPGSTDGFDDNLDIQAHDARKSEEYLDAAEQDPNIADGQLMINGSFVGAA
jgi:hypothetical protein